MKKKLDSFYLEYMGWIKTKKPSHATVPLMRWKWEEDRQSTEKPMSDQSFSQNWKVIVLPLRMVYTWGLKSGYTKISPHSRKKD
jgi:hypothetical protein